jgi:uncharacterized protein
MQFEEAGKFIMDKLRNELPANLVYHSIDHVADVYQAAARLATLENLSTQETQLLLTAAQYHDAGFIVKTLGHEEESCKIVQQVLPKFEYTSDEVEQICNLIRATQLPQSPKNHLQEILADSDLDYLGRNDYFTISQKLYEELLIAGEIGSMEEWKQAQINFMENHRYFTSTAINLRQATKEENLKKIKAVNYTQLY